MSNDEITRFLNDWAAAELAADAASIDRSLTDDFLGIGPLGFVLTKQAWLASRGPDGPLRYESFEFTETSVREYGDAAVVTSRVDQPGTYQGNPIPASPRVTLVLVKQSNEWQLASAHYSFIAGTPGAPPMPGPPQ